MLLRPLIFILICLFVQAAVFAQESEADGQIGGAKIYRFLDVPTGARTAALANTPIGGNSSDVEVGLIHAALLNENMHQSIVFHHNNYINDIAQSSFGGAWSLDSNYTLSLGGQIMNYGDFKRTDAIGNELGSFAVKDMALQAGMSYKIDSAFTVGGNFKFINSTYDSYQSSGIALDASVAYYRKSSDLHVLLALKNVGTQLTTYTDSTGEMPTNLMVSVYKRLGQSPLRFAVTADNLQQWDLSFEDPNRVIEIDPITGEVVNESKNGFGDKLMRHIKVGTEVFVSKSIQLRLGYDYRRRQELKLDQKTGASGISWGFALSLSYFQLSYGRASYHLSAPSNVFSLQWHFGDFLHKKS